MPDPISNSANSCRDRATSWEPEPEELVCREPSADPSTTNPEVSSAHSGLSGTGGAPSREQPPRDPVTHSEPSLGRDHLVARATKKPSLPPAANSSAQRTTAQVGAQPYARVGVISAGDSVFAEAALLKGRDPETVLEVEMFDVSGQVGLQTETKLTLGKVGLSSDDGVGSGSVEFASARARIGIHNDDGSTGFNLGAGASLLGGEISCQDGSGLSAGIAFGVSIGGHVGVRDQDGDGNQEICAGVEFMEGKLQGCVEVPVRLP